jgi:predicted GNAT superfamily acetyltransferase
MNTEPKIPEDDAITICRATTVADYHACQECQRQAWSLSDDSYLVPIATMVGANLHGGLVLGAFLATGEAVAMSFAFLGRIDRRICLYSQLTGVKPRFQSKGLGHAIKLRQREIAQTEGVERIAWAFDPLQAGNAHFNLGRLGATVGHYVDNMYGVRSDSLNAGVPTDRLIAEWDTAPRSQPRDSATRVLGGLPRLIETEQGTSPGIAGLAGDAPCVLLEIPSDILAFRRAGPALAEQWRAVVARAFTTAFAAGYRAVDFVRDDSPNGRRSFYVLERV